MFLQFVKKMTQDEIKSSYRFFNSALQMPNKYGFGENGAFEFLASVLLGEYESSTRQYILQIAKEVCSGHRSPLQFSSAIDSVIERIPHIKYEEWSTVYLYLKETQHNWLKDEWCYSSQQTVSPTIKSVLNRLVTKDNNDIPFLNEPISAVGVTFDNRQKFIEQLVLGQYLVLKREPQNLYDPNAIKIMTAKGDSLGYIPKEKAYVLAPVLDSGIYLYGEVLRIVGGNGLNYGFTFLIKPE